MCMFIISQFWDQRAKVIELRAIFVSKFNKIKDWFFSQELWNEAQFDWNDIGMGDFTKALIYLCQYYEAQ
jgi:hypothetical protein